MNTSNHFRRGLAMLGLTLTLPVLLFAMALMINYGTMAAWKVREESVARLAVWQTRWPRTGTTDPRPSYWPAAASIGASDGGSVAGMDDSRVEQPVVRGPMPDTTVNTELFDPTTGLRQGTAGYTRDFPLMRKFKAYTINAQTSLIDNKWQYQRMGMGSNWQRRMPVLYNLAEAPASLSNSYLQSVLALVNAPFASQLAPLNHDPDFLYYQALFGWGGPPDFYLYPQIQPMCTTDHSVTDPAVSNAINRIQGRPGKPRIRSVAEVMAEASLHLFERSAGDFSRDSQRQPARPAPDGHAGAVANSAVEKRNRNSPAVPQDGPGKRKLRSSPTTWAGSRGGSPPGRPTAC